MANRIADGDHVGDRPDHGAPGPSARQVAELYRLLRNAITEQDVRDVTDALLRRAMEGDVAAAKLVLQYAIGNP